MSTIREALPEETDALAAVLAPAFQDKVEAIVGDMDKALLIIPTVIEAMDGKVYVAEDPEKKGELLGAIIVTTKEPKFLFSSLKVTLKNLGLMGSLKAFRIILSYLWSVPKKMEKEGVLEAVGVTEEARGKRVGEQLVLKGSEYLRGLGYLHFGLGVKQGSAALRFYERLDFQKSGEYSNKLGKWYWMRKEL